MRQHLAQAIVEAETARLAIHPFTKRREKHPARVAAENPYRFFSFEEIGEIFGFGRDVMTAIAAHPDAPVVFRKMNPRLLLEWLRENHGQLGKTKGALK